MSIPARSKKDLFRKQQIEWIKIGAIWGIMLPGLAYIDFMYKNPIIYTVYIAVCYFAIKLTLKIRGHSAKLSADYKLMQQLEGLDSNMRVFSQFKVEAGKKEAKIEWVLVSKLGIWCVKVNIMPGKISGKEKEKNWCQVLKPKNPKSKTLSFPNPVLEVQYEAKRLKEYLRHKLKENIPVFPLVVFAKAEELDVPFTSEAVLLANLGKVFKNKDLREVPTETLDKVTSLLC